MKPQEYAAHDAMGLAELVRRREIAPRELVQAAIDRIEAGNPEINAVIHRRFEQALHEADTMAHEWRVPFAGVPFLLKDIGAAQAGVPQTQGNIALKWINHRPDADTPLGSRFRASGLVTVGVTNMPEFAALADTQPLAFGPTRNPRCRDRSAGGSSGGAAAAVAAGFVPVAHASDGGGSIRIPAAWCGVVGLKPSRGRIPKLIGAIDDISVAEFVITRTVRDTAAVLDVVSGALVGDLYGLPRPETPYSTTLTPPERALRVGVLTEGPAGMPVDPDCVRAVEETGALLQDAGHHVEATYPPAVLEATPDWVSSLRWHDDVRRLVEELEELLGRPISSNDVEPRTWSWLAESELVSAADLRAVHHWHLTRSARILEWWEQGFDLLVTPVTNALPDQLANLAAESPAQAMTTVRRHSAYLEPFNASGQPAIALPVRRTGDDIPVGVQLVAARGGERLLIRVAAQLEEAVGWATRSPNTIPAHSKES